MKTCTKCGEEKALYEYHRKTTTRDGRVSRCKKCVRAQKAEYYSQNRETLLAYKAEYYSRNRDAVLARKAERHARPEVKARHAEYMADYYQANPHIWWEYAYRTRARAYGYTPRVVSFTREALVERYGDQCYHCGTPWTEIDHHPVPVAHGGPHTIENTKPSCSDCNRAGATVRTTDTLKETA